MVVVRRRVIPIAVSAPTPTAQAKPGPVRRSKPGGVEAIRDALRAALPPKEAGERNTDGSTFLDTIKRYKAKVRNPMTAIRANCVECSGGSLKEVAECTVVKCALHPFRMGVNPLHKRTKQRLEGEAEDTQDEDTGNGE